MQWCKKGWKQALSPWELSLPKVKPKQRSWHTSKHANKQRPEQTNKRCVQWIPETCRWRGINIFDFLIWIPLECYHNHCFPEFHWNTKTTVFFLFCSFNEKSKTASFWWFRHFHFNTKTIMFHQFLDFTLILKVVSETSSTGQQSFWKFKFKSWLQPTDLLFGKGAESKLISK